jgi:hypothetical protein
MSNWGQTLTDGGGYAWTFSTFVNVNSNQHSALSGAMWLWINGQSPGCGNEVWENQAGDELETLSTSGVVDGLQIYRRAKIYKDAALGRWLDTFQNTSNAPITFTVRIGSNLAWNIDKYITSSGEAAPGEKDWAFVTVNPTQGGNAASILHVVGDRRAKVRPKLEIQGQAMNLDYPLTIPAGGTVCLCHFESLNTSSDELVKQMKAFQPSKYLRDLSRGVRALIANFPGGFGGLTDVELERSDLADTVILSRGDPLHGTIRNASYKVRTLLGDLDLPEGKVIGMAAPAGLEDTVRFLLTDGQVISGRTPEGNLALTLTGGGQLDIPLAGVKSWARRISKTHPDDAPPAGPMIVLRTGDQFAFDPADLHLTFRTRQGPVEVKAAEVSEIVLDNSGNGVHRAAFVNGSLLAGLLEPERIAFSLRLGQKLEASRDLIARIRLAGETTPDDALTRVLLTNDDEVLGSIVDETLTLVTDFGTIPIQPGQFRALRQDPERAERVILNMWNGSVYRGRLKEDELTFQVQPGPRLKLPLAQIRIITRSAVAVPDELRKEVEKLVARLGSESFKDRQTAADELAKKGAAILPLLQKHAQDGDPEVRQRLAEIIEKLGGGPARPPDPRPEILEESG